jgi:hypothetical protein
MLTRWTLGNFKPIREPLDLPTAPLTVLAGLNSSGKSSLLQSILLVSQTLANQELDEPLVLNGPLVRLGTFRDICNDRVQDGVVALGLTLDAGSTSKLGAISVDMQFDAFAQHAPGGLRATRAGLVHSRLTLQSDAVDLRRTTSRHESSWSSPSCTFTSAPRHASPTSSTASPAWASRSSSRPTAPSSSTSSAS